MLRCRQQLASVHGVRHIVITKQGTACLLLKRLLILCLVLALAVAANYVVAWGVTRLGMRNEMCE